MYYNYQDIWGVEYKPPASQLGNSPDTIWLLTLDHCLIGVPADKAVVVDTLPDPTKEDLDTLPKGAKLNQDVKPKLNERLSLAAGFIRINQRGRIPAGTYKIVAGGMGVTYSELKSAVDSSNYKSATHKLSIISWQSGEGHFAIEVLTDG